MLVLISHAKRGEPDDPQQLCEPCGRAAADKLKARWPEPHEHSADTRVQGSRYTIRVRVLKDSEGACDACGTREREVKDVELETVLSETFERIARRG